MGFWGFGVLRAYLFHLDIVVAFSHLVLPSLLLGRHSIISLRPSPARAIMTLIGGFFDARYPATFIVA